MPCLDDYLCHLSPLCGATLLALLPMGRPLLFGTQFLSDMVAHPTDDGYTVELARADGATRGDARDREPAL